MSRVPFPAVRLAGKLLSAGLFPRVLDDKSLDGRDSATYGLAAHETVREAASRAFDYLTGAWQGFAAERHRAAREGRPLTALTRDRWLLTLFRTLDYGLLATTPTGGLVADGKAFPVSHQWSHVPIHLLGWGTDLDHRTKGVAGAATAAPQSMLQELCNRSDDHLWAILSNGQTLRLLRDSRALAGSAYVEFDLELIFGEQLFSDWVLLYRLVHASRLAVAAGQSAASCWLETWRTSAINQGERALDRLRSGVEQAINALGTGFLRHPGNGDLRARLHGGTLAVDDYKRAVLRLVYRLLFWCVIEDRDVLLDPAATPAARDRYTRFFSAHRLRRRARRGTADLHHDLWDAVALVFTSLGAEAGRPELALPGLGGLFGRVTRDEHGDPVSPPRPDELDEPLAGLRLSNEALLTAVRHLAIISTDGQRRAVDFRNLDSEELGSVYESLLELHPHHDADDATFTLRAAAGNERKTTGSYYTPSSLTEALLDSALDPVLDRAVAGVADPDARIAALLDVTVCDPACGSGHFLVAAARRIARRVAQIRSGEDEPSPALVRAAMREVVSRCVHGVDINEMAAELAKVSLWLESVEPGRPLAFLDANIRVGNSLLGTTPALIEAGLPDAAFSVLTGDDKKITRGFLEDNRSDRAGQGSLFDIASVSHDNSRLAAATGRLVRELPANLSDLYVQRERLRRLDDDRRTARRIPDAWCAAFVQPKATLDDRASAITQATLGWIERGATTLQEQRTEATVDALARQYRFFHWYLEFPHIFTVDSTAGGSTGWRGGFRCVLGNPPWERVKLQEKEFFAARHEAIATARNAADRKKLIAALAGSDEPADRVLHAEFHAELRRAEGESHLLRDTGRYPLTGRGDINTYAVFAETGRTVISPDGQVGMVLPTGIATDATTQHFFSDLVSTRTLASVYDFENEEKLFPAVHHSLRFCLWTATGREVPQERIGLAFRLRQVAQLAERRFTLTPEEIRLLNPNTGTCPVFDHRRNAEITLEIYRRVPVLWREGEDGNPWNLSFMAMLHMANDSGLFRDRETLEQDGWRLAGNVFERGGDRMLPLYEAKMLHHYDHRLGSYDGQTQAQANMGTLPRSTPEQKDDPRYAVLPRYWVPEREVEDRLVNEKRRKDWTHDWLLGWRDICRSSDERTVIPSVLPRTAVGDKFLLLFTPHKSSLLQANLTSLVLDFSARQKIVGTSLKYFLVKQLPVLPPESYADTCSWDRATTVDAWIEPRAIELSYTSYDLESFAREHGDTRPPFHWDSERRFWLRAELDAAYFHLYGINRDDVDYVLDTFRAFRNNDPDRFARTKKAIVEIYDAMADAVRTSSPYRTVLDPPPGEGPRHPAGATADTGVRT